MGWFSADSNSIKHPELDSLLKDIPSLDRAEREYVKGIFIKYKNGNINHEDVEKAIRELKLNTSDIIDPAEAEAIKDKLLSVL
ncbi:MAG: hypothetical protein UV92_C0037G0003 [Parcubacteria group bacterium GW2011_GWA1_43_27]|nr:MAG: hypothetical protein UV92_C0037G0003 [Parcubacteria group bacterium GW2011_GWA1_43_27]